MNVDRQPEDVFWDEVFPGVAAKATEREPELSAGIRDYTRELRRFLTIARHCDVPLAMISLRIDALWHEFVNHTVTYRSYCQQFAGRLLDHMPRSDWFPIADRAISDFVTRYEAAYGRLPDLWFDGMQPALAHALRAGQNPAGFKWSGYVPS
jgi:hypothetical protein